MTIDLRNEGSDFRNYLCQTIDNHVRAGKAKPAMVHFGFSFDQEGWIIAFFDMRKNAARDGEWTTHLLPEMMLPRPNWHEASDLSDLRALILIGTDGKEVRQWTEFPDLGTFAQILGDFLRSSVTAFTDEGVFAPLIGAEKLEFCIEEFTGLYGWPVNTELLRLAELLKLSGNDPNPNIVESA